MSALTARRKNAAGAQLMDWYWGVTKAKQFLTGIFQGRHSDY
jgi:hypothetical protein